MYYGGAIYGIMRLLIHSCLNICKWMIVFIVTRNAIEVFLSLDYFHLLLLDSIEYESMNVDVHVCKKGYGFWHFYFSIKGKVVIVTFRVVIMMT